MTSNIAGRREWVANACVCLCVCLCVQQPTGLLMYLDSTDDVPEDDIDRINVRDNLKLAQVMLLVWFQICVRAS